MTAFSGFHLREYVMLHTDTQRLLIQLLDQELRKSDRRATRLYHQEIVEAKANFIDHVKVLSPDKNKS